MCLQIHKIAHTVLDTVITTVNTYITDNKATKEVINIEFVIDGVNYTFILTYKDKIEAETPE